MEKLEKQRMMDESERFVITELVNFIAQEAYRFAILKSLPDDYSQIRKLYSNIRKELSEFISHPNDIEKNDLIFEVVNLIVYQADQTEFQEAVLSIIDEQFEHVFYIVPSKKEILNIAAKLYDKNKGFNCRIPHKFPPHILGIDFNYDEVLEYIYGLAYKPHIQERVSISLFEDDEQLGTCISYTPQPFFSARQFEDYSLMKVTKHSNSIPIPQSALSKNREVQRKIINRPNVIESWAAFSFLPDADYADFCSEITLNIDMTKAISPLELEKLITKLKLEVITIQRENSRAKMLLAENEKELVEGFKMGRLDFPDFTTLEETFKTPIPELDTLAKAKNWLSGMILIKEHYYHKTLCGDSVHFQWKKNQDNRSQLQRAEDISAKLSEEHGEGGFSASMILKGVKLFGKLIKKYGDDLTAS